MKIPIKFRGRCVDNGEYIYGGCVQIAHASTTYIVSDSDGSNGNYRHFYPVDSVAQLVGYDVDGKEVYEGDTVLRYDSEEEFAEAPENGVLREVILYTQVNPDLESYYCFLKENQL